MRGFYVVRLNGRLRNYFPEDYELLLDCQREGWDDQIEVLGYVG